MTFLCSSDTADQIPAEARFRRACTECGAEFRTTKRHGDFCSEAHRKAWNNRRAMRGAELYDLVMCLRYDRETATALKVWRLICRMASEFRDEDQRQRAGRKSWRSARQVIERHPYLQATVIASKTWRRAL